MSLNGQYISVLRSCGLNIGNGLRCLLYKIWSRGIQIDISVNVESIETTELLMEKKVKWLIFNSLRVKVYTSLAS